MDDYTTLKTLWPVLTRAAALTPEILGIVERAMILKAQIPALEQQRVKAEADLAKIKEAYGKAYGDAVAQESAINAAITDLKAQRAAETKALETDRFARIDADTTGRTRIRKEHEAAMADLVKMRDGLKAEIATLSAQRTKLQKDLKDLIAAVPTG